jgi:hypothetical protein
MSDPVSIASGAAGLISLGLTLCQGLVQYYDAWKHQDRDIGNVSSRLVVLKDILELLVTMLPNLDRAGTSLAARVENCLLACLDGMAVLDKTLERCRSSSTPSSFSDRAHATGRRAMFPFRKSTIRSLTSALLLLETNLGLALQVLQL